MTTEDLVARYKSDADALHRLYDEEKIDRTTLDNNVEALDNKLFSEFGFTPTTTESNLVDQIAAYS